MDWVDDVWEEVGGGFLLRAAHGDEVRCRRRGGRCGSPCGGRFGRNVGPLVLVDIFVDVSEDYSSVASWMKWDSLEGF